MPELEARIILKERAGLEWADILADGGREIHLKSIKQIENDIQRLLAGEPLSRIYGVREFWGLEFALNAHTLDPRQDTEILVERALEAFPGSQPEAILDLGTGTGCIIIALLKEWTDARGVAVDLSYEALQCARENALRHGVEKRLSFVQGSWGEALGQGFDLVVSNPPYISPSVIANLDENVRNYDPILALDGGKDGLEAYKKIFIKLSLLLNDGGRALFEIGYDQEKTVMRLAGESRFSVHGVYADLAGNPRVVDISCGDK